MKKNFSVILIIIIVGLSSSSYLRAQSATSNLAPQEEKKTSKPSENKDKIEVQFYGFIRNDIFMDTRQMIGAGENLVTLYPKDKLLDVNKQDINAAPKFHMLSILSRAGINVKGPVLLEAKTAGILEGDFFGSSEGGINEFRLRHAYLTLDWNKTQLGIGQYWHPFVVPEAVPNVVNYGTGVPIYTLNRNPQIRLTQMLAKNLKVAVALVSQRDFTANTEPFRNSGMPAAHFQAQYKIKNFIVGAAAHYENLKPKLLSGTPPIKSNERAESVSLMAYSVLNTKPLKITLTGYLMQDASSFVQLGAIIGYQTNPQTLEVYKPINSPSIWMDLQQNTTGKFALGLFVGYIKNNGVENPVEGALATPYGVTASWGAISATPGSRTVNYLYKIVPRLDFSSGKALKFRFELDMIGAQWADATIKGNGTQNTYLAKNYRFHLATVYNF